MKIHDNDVAVSEVIGFVLILGVIVAFLSVYMVYAVPAQGRENEIAQMDLVRDRFMDYKISLDPIWITQQNTTTISTSFPLGTSGGFTLGGFLSIMNPVGSSALLAVNQRGETLTIASDSLVMADGAGEITSDIIYGTPEPFTIETAPRRFIINITRTPETAPPIPEGVRVNTTDWCVWANMTPRWEYYKYYTWTLGKNKKIENLQEHEGYKYNRTDLTITVVKGGTIQVEDLIVYGDVSQSTVYDVNLMEPAYGLTDVLSYPMTPETLKSDNAITGYYRVEHGYEPDESTNTFTMGEIEYRSEYHYWVQQDYYYQLGGVFLAQDDGATCKVPPAISLYNASGTARVKITGILLTGGGVIGGSSPVQVQTLLDDVGEMPYAGGSNSRWVNISVAAGDEESGEMWRRVFLDAADRGGMTSDWYTNGTRGESYINITGPSAGDEYDVQLEVTLANFTVTLQNVAGATG